MVFTTDTHTQQTIYWQMEVNATGSCLDCCWLDGWLWNDSYLDWQEELNHYFI